MDKNARTWLYSWWDLVGSRQICREYWLSLDVNLVVWFENSRLIMKHSQYSREYRASCWDSQSGSWFESSVYRPRLIKPIPRCYAPSCRKFSFEDLYQVFVMKLRTARNYLVIELLFRNYHSACQAFELHKKGQRKLELGQAWYPQLAWLEGVPDLDLSNLGPSSTEQYGCDHKSNAMLLNICLIAGDIFQRKSAVLV